MNVKKSGPGPGPDTKSKHGPEPRQYILVPIESCDSQLLNDAKIIKIRYGSVLIQLVQVQISVDFFQVLATKVFS